MAQKRVYIAAKIVPGNDVVRTLLARFESHGFRCAYDWTRNLIDRPFSDNRAAQQAADQMIEAIVGCDVFILLATSEIIGALGELVAALGAARRRRKRRLAIYVVGSDEVRERCLFYHSSGITRWCHTLEELLAEFTIE